MSNGVLQAAYGIYTETSPENLEVSRIKLPSES